MSFTQANTTYDIIFAGGGAAACVTAGRLAAADPSLKILIVEAGPHTLEDLAHIQPARFLTHLMPGSKTMKFIVAPPTESLGGRSLVVPAAQVLGGGSSVNFAMYNRAAASDYDDWETKFNNPGWGSKSLVPLLEKTETYQPDPHAKTHGSSGPLQISWGGIFTNPGKEYLEVAAKYDKERPIFEDGNSVFECNGYARWPKWINGKTGHRSDTPHHYIYNQSSNKNLEVLTGHFVKRVVFEGKRASGVELVPNPNTPGEKTSSTLAYAKKLVVVSGGSFGSPLILERSGIGAGAILEKYGIKPVVDLPGVGDDYQDHNLFVPLYHAEENTDSLDSIMLGEPEAVEKWNAQWQQDGSGLMSTNGIDAGIKYRPNASEVTSIGPAFEETWKTVYANAPDRSTFWLGTASFCYGALGVAPPRKYYGVASFMNHPTARGSVHITSAEDPAALPEFVHGFLEHDDDLELCVFAYKRGREMARRMASYRGEYLDQHPVFPEGSEAAVVPDNMPVPIDAPDIKYTKEDDEAIRTFVRKFVGTTWHSLGTCAMKPREEGGVVDSRLNVYGVEGLKVADLSIAPGNVSANTYSTTTVIGEKAAVIIGEDLGIKNV